MRCQTQVHLEKSSLLIFMAPNFLFSSCPKKLVIETTREWFFCCTYCWSSNISGSKTGCFYLIFLSRSVLRWWPGGNAARVVLLLLMPLLPTSRRRLLLFFKVFYLLRDRMEAKKRAFPIIIFEPKKILNFHLILSLPPFPPNF